MPMFRIEDEHGQWLTNLRLGPPDWKPGDRISRGTDTLEVIEVRHTDYEDEFPALVVRTVQPERGSATSSAPGSAHMEPGRCEGATPFARAARQPIHVKRPLASPRRDGRAARTRAR
jgi:hypothetical protein